jgi:HD-like signal output (HDOD) protein
MKKRILFVDDEPLLLQLYTSMMEDERDLWEVVTTTDPRHALQIMEQSPFDVVVSDMMMPGMDGTDLLNEIKVRHPLTSRIILSVLGDQERVARFLGDTHQFIAKPFDVQSFKATLARVCGLDAYLKNETLRALIGQLSTLPSFPSLYLEVIKEVSSPDSSIESVAAIVAEDAGMTAKMLQIVNSAVFGLAHRVGSSFEAVQYLGFGMLRSLVLSTHIFSSYERTRLKGFSVDLLWSHALRCGTLARMIMQLEGAGPAEVEHAYTAGILHDMGKLMMAHSLPGRFQKALALAADRRISSHEAEIETFGASHAGVAAYLLGLWGLPTLIVEAVALHHQPSDSDVSDFGVLTAVHVANVLEHELVKTESGGRPAALDMSYLADAGVQNRLEAWRSAAVELMNSRV